MKVIREIYVSRTRLSKKLEIGKRQLQLIVNS